MREEIVEIARALKIEAGRRHAREEALQERLREILPGAIRRGEGLVMTVWENDRRWELDASPFVPADKCYVLYPDRAAPEVPNGFLWDPEPLRDMPVRRPIAKLLNDRIL